ncbi:MAG: hypothetical protein ISN28_16000 [Ectothiorhodospiraceae bacterium AqS1]|nr:hypothetical protein [Ectothiorhodospiraceae bacterium AqS1]
MTKTNESKSYESSKLIAAFGEDPYHRAVIGGLIQRISKEVDVVTRTQWHNAFGGYGRVVREMKQYVRYVRSRAIFPDLIVVVTDANCKGYNARYKNLSVDRNFVPPIVCAIPDPHVEHWLLLDGKAFKKIFGQGFQTPKRNKCERDFYKKVLSDAYINTKADLRIGGIECAKKIVSEMNLKRAAMNDSSLQKFLDDLRQALK